MCRILAIAILKAGDIAMYVFFPFPLNFFYRIFGEKRLKKVVHMRIIHGLSEQSIE